MADKEALKASIGRFKLGQTTACEFHKALFTLSPEIRIFYDAEDLDPDQLIKSRKFMMIGLEFLQSFLHLPDSYGTNGFDQSVGLLVSGLREDFSLPLAEFKKFTPAVHEFLGCNDEEKQAWTTLMDEVYVIAEGRGM